MKENEISIRLYNIRIYIYVLIITVLSKSAKTDAIPLRYRLIQFLQ